MSADSTRTAERQESKEEAHRREEPVALQGAVFAQNVGTQHLHSAPHAQAAIPERRDSNSDILQQLMQAVQLQTQQMQQMQQQINVLNRSDSRRSISAALHTVHGEKVGEYSASAAVQRPPVLVVQQRSTDVRRQSIGIPSSSFTPGPVATPAPRQPSTTASVRRMDSLYESTEEDGQVEARDAAEATAVRDSDVDDGLPVFDPRMVKVREAIVSIMKPFPFYGQTDTDKLNVLSWVEKIDTEFSIYMGTRQAGRLDIVRILLAGPALRWMNDTVTTLKKKADRGELDEVIEWETLRQAFIDQHLGVHTVETFKAQLRALRLGSTTTPSPVELNQEFDRIAAMAYPNHQSDMRGAVLGDEYGTIIASSNMTIYKSVAYNNHPSNLEEWKLHVSQRWAAGKNVEAVEARVRGPSSGRGGGRAGFGRGGGGGQKSPATVQVAAMYDGAGPEGEDQGGETGEDDVQQLAAVYNGQGGRGGRGGGRGGRGGGRGGRDGGAGGGGNRPWTEAERKEKHKLLTCNGCGQKGHVIRHCRANLSNPTDQSN
jgi:hypothetical protein